MVTLKEKEDALDTSSFALLLGPVVDGGGPGVGQRGYRPSAGPALSCPFLLLLGKCLAVTATAWLRKHKLLSYCEKNFCFH